MMRLIPCFLAAALAAAGQSPRPTDWRFADPGATLAGSVDMEALARSPLVKEALDSILSMLPGGPPTIAKAVQGWNLARISFTVLDRKPEPEVLALVEGEWDDKAVSQFAQGKLQVHRLSPNTVLLGNGPSLAQAVKRMAVRAGAENALAARGKELAAANDLWIVGRLPAAAEIAGLPLGEASLGLSVRDDLRLELSLDAKDAALAAALADKARESQRQAVPGATFESSVQGTAVRMRFSMDRAHVIASLREAISGRMGAPGRSESRDTAIPPPPPPKPQRKTVIIYGLDDGPREIPLDKP